MCANSLTSFIYCLSFTETRFKPETSDQIQNKASHSTRISFYVFTLFISFVVCLNIPVLASAPPIKFCTCKLSGVRRGESAMAYIRVLTPLVRARVDAGRASSCDMYRIAGSVESCDRYRCPQWLGNLRYVSSARNVVGCDMYRCTMDPMCDCPRCPHTKCSL